MELQQMEVAVLVNGTKVADLTLRQTDPMEWFEATKKIDESSDVTVVVSDDEGTSGVSIIFGLQDEGEYVIECEKKMIRRGGGWKRSVTWSVMTPKRANFPGEPEIPRYNLDVELKLVSPPHPSN